MARDCHAGLTLDPHAITQGVLTHHLRSHKDIVVRLREVSPRFPKEAKPLAGDLHNSFSIGRRSRGRLRWRNSRWSRLDRCRITRNRLRHFNRGPCLHWRSNFLSWRGDTILGDFWFARRPFRGRARRRVLAGAAPGSRLSSDRFEICIFFSHGIKVLPGPRRGRPLGYRSSRER